MTKKTEKTDRNNKIRFLRSQGMKVKHIAKRYGISRQRVSQICGTVDGYSIRADIKKERIISLRKRGWTAKEVGKLMGISEATVYKYSNGLGFVYNTPERKARDREIMRLHKEGVSGTEIARRFGVSDMTVSRIINCGRNTQKDKSEWK